MTISCSSPEPGWQVVALSDSSRSSTPTSLASWYDPWREHIFDRLPYNVIRKILDEIDFSTVQPTHPRVLLAFYQTNKRLRRMAWNHTAIWCKVVNSLVQIYPTKEGFQPRPKLDLLEFCLERTQGELRCIDFGQGRVACPSQVVSLINTIRPWCSNLEHLRLPFHNELEQTVPHYQRAVHLKARWCECPECERYAKTCYDDQDMPWRGAIDACRVLDASLELIQQSPGLKTLSMNLPFVTSAHLVYSAQWQWFEPPASLEDIHFEFNDTIARSVEVRDLFYKLFSNCQKGVITWPNGPAWVDAPPSSPHRQRTYFMVDFMKWNASILKRFEWDASRLQVTSSFFGNTTFPCLDELSIRIQDARYMERSSITTTEDAPKAMMPRLYRLRTHAMLLDSITAPRVTEAHIALHRSADLKPIITSLGQWPNLNRLILSVEPPVTQERIDVLIYIVRHLKLVNLSFEPMMSDESSATPRLCPFLNNLIIRWGLEGNDWSQIQFLDMDLWSRIIPVPKIEESFVFVTHTSLGQELTELIEGRTQFYRQQCRYQQRLRLQ